MNIKAHLTADKKAGMTKDRDGTVQEDMYAEKI